MRRHRFRQGLHPLFLPIYDFLCANLPEHWQPYRGMIAFDDQAERYAQGRTVRGRVVTQDKPGESPNNYGCAVSWTVFHRGEPTHDIHPHDWAFFAQIVEKAGGHWGGRLFMRDKGLVELPIRSTWVKVNEVRKTEGFEACQKYIEEMHRAE